nr:ATP-citrate synthase beta chain protein 2 [Tanacetum cinerariifolium]
MKPWVDVIRENAIFLGGHKDHVSACLCHMFYCIESSTPYNLAFFILKRMEKTRKKPKELLPYGMILSRLFKHVMSVFPELAIDNYLSFDHVMHPFDPHYEQNTRSDHGKKRHRESNASSFSTTQDHPFSSLPPDAMIAENDDESSHPNSSSPSQQVSSSSTVFSRVCQNPSHESHILDTFLSETINLQTQQRDAHRDKLRMVVKEIVSRLLEEEGVSHFGKEVLPLEEMFFPVLLFVIMFCGSITFLSGRAEYSLVEALEAGKINKPVCAWVNETSARLFKSEVQFGDVGAMSGGEMESAQAKNQALMDAGAIVPTSYEAFETSIKEAFAKLADEGKISPIEEITPPQIPGDLNTTIKSGKICIMLCADHGPCASGAHNTIVTARAGKDLISCLVSGLLTIGPRFGGAIDDAARYFKDAYDRKLAPYEFVESMKKKGIRVPGIGHRIKRGDNPDKRVELLQLFARTNFPTTKLLALKSRTKNVIGLQISRSYLSKLV